MTMRAATTVLLLPLLPTVRPDCRVGDVVYVSGEPTGGHIPLECVNETSYDGTASACLPTGEVGETELRFACPDFVPHCVQCGPRGFGAALCLSSPDPGDRDCGGDGPAGAAAVLDVVEEHPGDDGDGQHSPLHGDEPAYVRPESAPFPDDDEGVAAPIPPGGVMDDPPPAEDFLPPSTPAPAEAGLFDQCDNDADLVAWRASDGNVLCDSGEFAGVDCQEDAGCVMRCFREARGYTEPCAACFAGVPQCLSDLSCPSYCTSGGSFAPECKGCQVPCVADLDKCTGLPQISTDPSAAGGGVENDEVEDSEDNDPGDNVDVEAPPLALTGAVSTGDTTPTTVATDATSLSTIAASDAATTQWSSSCGDGRAGIDDPSCTLSLRESTCEGAPLDEAECLALGCCQWSGSRCSAACIIPDDGDACCHLVGDEGDDGSDPLGPNADDPAPSPAVDVTPAPIARTRTRTPTEPAPPPNTPRPTPSPGPTPPPTSWPTSAPPGMPSAANDSAADASRAGENASSGRVAGGAVAVWVWAGPAVAYLITR